MHLPSVRSTACRQVWTYKGRVAFVLSITEKGMPVVDGIKLQRLRQLVLGERRGMGAGTGFCCNHAPAGNAACFVLAASSQAITPGRPAALAHHLPHAHLLQAS